MQQQCLCWHWLCWGLCCIQAKRLSECVCWHRWWPTYVPTSLSPCYVCVWHCTTIFRGCANIVTHAPYDNCHCLEDDSVVTNQVWGCVCACQLAVAVCARSLTNRKRHVVALSLCACFDTTTLPARGGRGVCELPLEAGELEPHQCARRPAPIN